jgi:hypothetical protein
VTSAKDATGVKVFWALDPVEERVLSPRGFRRFVTEHPPASLAKRDAIAASLRQEDLAGSTGSSLESVGRALQTML